jgi:hypothetical protein
MAEFAALGEAVAKETGSISERLMLMFKPKARLPH